jgi:hypothetical protein
MALERERLSKVFGEHMNESIGVSEDDLVITTCCRFYFSILQHKNQNSTIC